MPRHSLPGRGIMKSQRVESQQTQQQWSAPLPKMVLSPGAKRRGQAPVPRQGQMRRNAGTRAMVEELRSLTRHSRECGNPSSLCNAIQQPGGGQASAQRQDPMRRSTSTRAMVEELRSLTRHSRECGNPSSLCNAIQQPGGAQAPALRQDPMRRSTSTRVMIEKLRSLTRHSRECGNPSSLCNASRPAGHKPPRYDSTSTRMIEKLRSRQDHLL